MQHVENELDQTIEKLSSTNTKFDEKDKAFQLAEGESQALSRKLVLEEAEFERTESTLVTITAELTEKSNLADTINKAIKVLETKNMIDEESKQKNSYPSFLFRKILLILQRSTFNYHLCLFLGIDLLENQVKEAKTMVEESDIKYDEVARKLAMVEGDLQRAEERANQGIIDNYNHMKRV